MADFVDPRLALRWLGLARRGTLAAQVLVVVAAEAGTTLHLHSPSMFGLVVGWAAWDVAQAAWLRRREPPPRSVIACSAVDLGALTGILVLSGGPHHPLLFGYLAWLALLAMVLPATQAWMATAAAVSLEAFVVLHPAPGTEYGDEVGTTAHLLNHIVTFDVSAATITWVVTRLSAALRQRAAVERDQAQRQAVTARLAALGTLAAGVAHELGTPLGAIQLLAEKARRRAGSPEAEAPLTTLLEQVARCRAMLDRLRGRDAPSGSACVLDVEQWVAEWQRAAPDLDISIVSAASGERVAGAEESWRGALWVALDNARRARARHVVVATVAEGERVRLTVDDDGVGLQAGADEHAGEPFWTGWQGTGLGLFVARTFAASVGGEVSLEPREGGGARVRMDIPRSQP